MLRLQEAVDTFHSATNSGRLVDDNKNDYGYKPDNTK
jgi:hypothetical protein